MTGADPTHPIADSAPPVLWPLAAMMLVQIITTMAFVTVPVLAPAIVADLHIDSSRVGLYSSIAFAGAAMITLMSGALVQRHGGIRVNQASVVLSTTGLLLTITASVPFIALGALVAGMGYGLAAPGASHVLARVASPARRGLVFSIKQAAMPLGGLLVGLLAPSLADRYGWPTAIMMLSAAIVLAAPAIQPLRARLDDDRDPRHRISIGAPGSAIALVLATPALRSIALVAFSFATMQLSLFSFLVTYLVERVRLDLVTAGLVFSVMQISGMVARVTWGWVSDQVLPARPLLALIGVGTVASTLAAIGLGPGWSLGAVMAVAAALGITAVGWNGVYLAEVARVVPLHQVGPATGGVLMFTFAGVVLGPSTFGMIVERTHGYAAAFLALDALIAVTIATLLLQDRRRSPSVSDGA